MFNRTVIMADHRPQNHYHETIVKRAPTDESVKLLKEMESAARDKVLASTVVENTPVSSVLHAEMDFLSGQRVFVVTYSLNGKKDKCTVRTSAHEDFDRYAIAGQIVEKLGQQIARELVADSFAKAVRNIV